MSHTISCGVCGVKPDATIDDINFKRIVESDERHLHWLIDPNVVCELAPAVVIRVQGIIFRDMQWPILGHELASTSIITNVHQHTSNNSPTKLDDPGL